jgi:hypothetical protein
MIKDIHIGCRKGLLRGFGDRATACFNTPPNLEALYTTANSYSALGDLQSLQASTQGKNYSKRKEFLERARHSYQLSLDTWGKIQHPGRVTPQGLPAMDPDAVATNLRRCEAALLSNGDINQGR